MNYFQLSCPHADDPVEVEFTGETVARGRPAFRGFACEHESLCEAAGVKCALFDAEGFEAFDPAEALKHLNG